MALDVAKSGAAESGRFERLFSSAAQEGRQIELAAGRVVHEPGDPAEFVYFVHSGQVRIHQLGPDGQSVRLVEILGPEDWFGAAALAHTRTYGTRATAVTDAVVSEVPAERWHAALASTPEVAAEVIGQLARKLQAAHEDAGRLVFDDCNDRLVKTLLRFSHSAAATRGEDGDVVLRITHQQLAQAVGAARETISLALTQLRQRELLKTGRNQLFFNPDVLRRVCLNDRAAGSAAVAITAAVSEVGGEGRREQVA
ncbi:MAG: Crp/Fnr family transcriptional regulator [Pseudomonadota bacterium]|nr:Crp/Fnr family transcriptional regulator [Pseudomonadota bacterium]